MSRLYQKLLELEPEGLGFILILLLLLLSMVILGTVEYVTTMIIELNK